MVRNKGSPLTIGVVLCLRSYTSSCIFIKLLAQVIITRYTLVFYLKEVNETCKSCSMSYYFQLPTTFRIILPYMCRYTRMSWYYIITAVYQKFKAINIDETLNFLLLCFDISMKVNWYVTIIVAPAVALKDWLKRNCNVRLTYIESCTWKHC